MPEDLQRSKISGQLYHTVPWLQEMHRGASNSAGALRTPALLECRLRHLPEPVRSVFHQCAGRKNSIKGRPFPTTPNPSGEQRQI